jgi:hypothetical protein
MCSLSSVDELRDYEGTSSETGDKGDEHSLNQC